MIYRNFERSSLGPPCRVSIEERQHDMLPDDPMADGAHECRRLNYIERLLNGDQGGIELAQALAVGGNADVWLLEHFGAVGALLKLYARSPATSLDVLTEGEEDAIYDLKTACRTRLSDLIEI